MTKFPVEDMPVLSVPETPGPAKTPPIEKTPRLANILVYEWQAWDGYLISKLVAENCRVSAAYEDDIAQLEHALTPEIEAVLLQINLSVSHHFPEKRTHLIATLQDRGLQVFNCSLDDITKRNLHALLTKAGIPSAKAERAGDPDEALFVKSNLNWGGEKENGLPAAVLEKYGIQLPGSRINRHNGYYKAPRKNIGEGVWSDPTLVVEKYFENHENSFYRVYRFGQSIVVVKAHAPELIKKISGHENDINFLFSKDAILLNTTHLPANLQKVLRQFLLNIDLAFFCLDIVHDLHDFYIIDLNLTPFHGSHEVNPVVKNFMIKGILQQLDNPH